MLFRVHSAAVLGNKAYPVAVEVDLSSGDKQAAALLAWEISRHYNNLDEPMRPTFKALREIPGGVGRNMTSFDTEYFV